jgi:hypothetical protein
LALIVIAFALLGVFILFGLLICKGFGSKVEASPQATTLKPNPTNNPSEPEQGVMEKLNTIHKEAVLGTSVAIYGLAFAIVIYSITIIFDNFLQGVVGLILAYNIYWLGDLRNRNQVNQNKKLYRWVLLAEFVILVSISILSIYHVIKIPR